MFFSFFAGNVFIDSYDLFIVRLQNPGIDMTMIFLISLILLLFLYKYFRPTLKFAFNFSYIGTAFLIFTWFGLMGILMQNMLVPLNHFISYLEVGLIIFLLGALLLGQISEKSEKRLKMDYLTFLICLVFVNTIFIIIKKLVYEKLGTSGVNLVAEIDLLGATFNVTSLLLLVFVMILGLMIWNSVKNFQIVANDIKQKNQLDYNNKNFQGIILNQGVLLLSLLGLVFFSFYLMKNQNTLKDFMHYSFAANVNYYATLKWTYLCNLSFFIPFATMFFQMDLSKKVELDEYENRIEAPLYNFNMNIVLNKHQFEAVIAEQQQREIAVESAKNINEKIKSPNRIANEQGNFGNSDPVAQ
jgi:hypothetical protein